MTDRDYLTDAELETVRDIVAEGQSLHPALARLLLADRDAWVKRAHDAAGLTP